MSGKCDIFSLYTTPNGEKACVRNVMYLRQFDTEEMVHMRTIGWNLVTPVMEWVEQFDYSGWDTVEFMYEFKFEN